MLLKLRKDFISIIASMGGCSDDKKPFVTVRKEHVSFECMNDALVHNYIHLERKSVVCNIESLKCIETWNELLIRYAWIATVSNKYVLSGILNLIWNKARQIGDYIEKLKFRHSRLASIMDLYLRLSWQEHWVSIGKCVGIISNDVVY